MSRTKNYIIQWKFFFKESDKFWHRKMTLEVRKSQYLTTFTQLTARLKNFLKGWLLVLGLKEGLVECATLCIKSEVILVCIEQGLATTVLCKKFSCTFFLGWHKMKVENCKEFLSLAAILFHCHTYRFILLHLSDVTLLQISLDRSWSHN